MADRHQLTRRVMRRGTRFHADQARRQLSEEADNFGPAQLAPDQNCAIGSASVNLKHILRRSNPTVTTSCSMEQFLDVDLQRPHHRTTLLGAEVVHDITSPGTEMKSCGNFWWRND